MQKCDSCKQMFDGDDLNYQSQCARCSGKQDAYWKIRQAIVQKKTQPQGKGR